MRKIIGIFLLCFGIYTIGEVSFWMGLLMCFIGGWLIGKKDTPVQTQTNQPVRKYYTMNQTNIQTLPSDYVVIDFETTGLNPGTERIIEVGAVRVKGGKVEASFNQFVNPEKNITKRITDLTGITNADVYGAPSESNVIPELVRFSEGFMLVAHNADFDLRFLAAALTRCGINATLEYIDTLALAREHFPDRSSYKLADLIEDYGLAPGPQTHRALDDVLATKNLYELIRTGKF